MLPRSVKRVLIVHQGAIGDFILSLPAIGALREFYPEAHFEMVGFPHILSVANGRYYADNIVSIDGKDWVVLYNEGSHIPQRLIDYLSAFNLAIVFTANPSQIFIKNLGIAGIDEVFAIKTFPTNGESIHITDYILSSLSNMGLQVSNIYPKLYLKESDRLFARKFLMEHSVNHDKPLVAIHPGGGGRKKIWMPQRFARFASELSHKLEATFIVIGGPADEPFVKRMLNEIYPLDHILVKDLPLTHVASILEECYLYVGNDSGITHLAASLGVPTIAIFGPTDPKVWAPRGPHVSILTPGVSCSPCSKKAFYQCDFPACLASIDVDDIMKKTLEFMKDSVGFNL